MLRSVADLPLWFRLGVLGVVTALLIFNVVWDATHVEYEGISNGIMLAGLIAAGIGIDRLSAGRGGDKE